jgi:phosphoribosylglycinamide formyltransferase-1|tara:strand:+ start:13786 stop:14421 length:636 start_codon:yes stop_codon:yes gene_type:complete
MVCEGKIPSHIFAAPRVELTHYQSKIRIAPQGLKTPSTKLLAKNFDIPYIVVPHNSKECIEIVRREKITLGLVLGARIMSKELIDSFEIGILNLHPGLLPLNRGLDAIKWAVIKDWDQGVTAHLIDGQVDRGLLICKNRLLIYSDDNLLDIYIRIMRLEYDTLISALDMIAGGVVGYPVKEYGPYHNSMPPEIEKDLMVTFMNYKLNRAIQ